MKVLVVHEARAIRVIISRTLHRLGGIDYVAEAENADTAVDLLSRRRFDFVLCDWKFGGMTGLDLLEALRLADVDVHFGLVTAEDDPAARSQAIQAGAAFFLVEPFSADELVEALRGVEPTCVYWDPSSPLTRSEVGEHRADRRRAVRVGPRSHLIPPEQLARSETMAALLSKMCERSVTVTPVAAWFNRRSPRYVATYCNNEGKPRALCVFSTRLAIAIAASLTNWPRKQAEEWARAGAIPHELIGDLREFASVLARFALRGTEHVTLDGVIGYAPGEALPPDTGKLRASGSEHFQVEIADYSEGPLSMIDVRLPD